MSDVIPGGMTEFRSEITQPEQIVFKKATGQLMGVHYSPVAVATQVVRGIKYSFFCNTRAVHPNAPNNAAMVDIYAPVEGEPHVTGIHQVQA